MTPEVPTGGAGGVQRKLRQLAELPVGELRQVGPRTETELAELGIASVLDLLTHYPRRYIDGTRLQAIADLVTGEKASVLARVTRVSQPSAGYGRGRRRGPSRVELEIADDSGRLRVVFFNQNWRAKQLPVGTLALFFGAVGTYRDALQLNSPMAEVLELPAEANEGDDGQEGGLRRGRIYPIYSLTDKAKLTSARISRITGEALDRARDFADPVEPVWRDRFGLVDRTTAFNHIHRPRPPTRPNLPGAAWPSTNCFASNWRWSCARPGSSGTPGASAMWSRAAGGTATMEPARPDPGRAVHQPAALLVDPGPAGRHGGHRHRPGRAVAHAPAAAGGRRVGQDGGRPRRHADRRARGATRPP